MPSSPTAINAALEILQGGYGNPSAAHGAGLRAEARLREARKQVCALAGCREDELFFTSGGTESNNLCLLGAVEAMRHKGKRLIASDSEHPSVLEPLKRLANKGFELVLLPTRGGVLDLKALEEALNEDTVLVSIQAVNSETGAAYDLSAVAEILRRRQSQALFHTDAVQALGKIPLQLSRLGVHLASFSAHKLGGLPGIGAVYVQKGCRISPPYLGGGQENGLRSGTENLPAIAAFGAAAEEARLQWAYRLENAQRVRQVFLDRLSGFEQVHFHLPPHASVYILNLSLQVLPSEVMLNALSAKGAFVSAGSACSSRKKSAGSVLRAFGAPASQLDHALRFSFGYQTTPQMAHELCDLLVELFLSR